MTGKCDSGGRKHTRALPAAFFVFSPVFFPPILAPSILDRILDTRHGKESYLESLASSRHDLWVVPWH